MVDPIRKAWIVSGMGQASKRGYGQVGAFLEREGIARSTGYRWKREVEWCVTEAPQEIARLRAALEVERLAFERFVASMPSAQVREPAGERGFVLLAAVLGNSDTQVADLLAKAGGRRLSHQTIHRIIAEASARARKAFDHWFAGVGSVAAADEIFLGQRPLLLMVEPLSLLISGALLAEGRRAEDWKPVFAAMEALERIVADRGQGIAAAAKEAGVERGADIWHLLNQGPPWLASLERSCYSKLETGYGDPETAAALEEFDRLTGLFRRVRRAFDPTTPDGRLNTAERARREVAAAMAEMRRSKTGRQLAAKLCGVEDAHAFAHLEVLEAGLGCLGLEQVGPDREAALARLVAESAAWRNRDKTPVEELALASTGSLGDELELALLKVIDLAIRASSAVEGVNARIRLVQVARKRLSADFIYLLAVYHNMQPFGRGSVREGRTPAELAGLQLPTADWVELLDRAADPPEQTATQAA